MKNSLKAQTLIEVFLVSLLVGGVSFLLFAPFYQQINNVFSSSTPTVNPAANITDPTINPTVYGTTLPPPVTTSAPTLGACEWWMWWCQPTTTTTTVLAPPIIITTTTTTTTTITTTTTVAGPPNPACGAITIGTLVVSSCNNTYNLVPNGSNPGAAGCWQGLNVYCSDTGCGRPVCNHAGAVKACEALNQGKDYGTNNWRLPTNKELQSLRITPGSASRLTATALSLNLCDSIAGYSPSAFSPYCFRYAGCSGSYYNLCYPDILWSADSYENYYYDCYMLYIDTLYGPNSQYPTSALSVRCVRDN
ncbi:MAG: DUF1566 domain-containing protein [bacterium]